MSDVEIDLDFIRETDNAYLVSDGDQEVWLPKTWVERDRMTFTMPEWLAIDRGLV